MTTHEEVFFTSVWEPRPAELRLSLRILGAQGRTRRAEHVELLTAEEMQRGTFRRVHDFADRDEVRNALAAFLWHRVYAASGQFVKGAGELLVPGGV